MAAIAWKRATYADLEAVPPHLVAEIIDGSLVTHPRPTPRHTKAANELYYELNGPFGRGVGGPGGWTFLGEPELHLGSDVVVPDVAGWRTERLSPFPEGAWIGVAPDWVCESLSSSTEVYDRGPKRQLYGRAGVGHLWLVDSRARLLEVFALREGNWLLIGTFQGADEVSAPPFDSIAIGLEALWRVGNNDTGG